MEATDKSKKTKWVIDPAHSEIGFRVKHLMVANVRGVFKEFDASIYTTGDDFMTAEIDFWLNPASVYTGDQKRDAHLRSADFFDVETFKEINFTPNTIEKGSGEGTYSMSGDLTIRGIKKRINVDVAFGGVIKDPWGNQKAAFNLTGKIHRKDWDLNWNAVLESGGVLVSDEVWINCEVELAKQV